MNGRLNVINGQLNNVQEGLQNMEGELHRLRGNLTYESVSSISFISHQSNLCMQVRVQHHPLAESAAGTGWPLDPDTSSSRMPCLSKWGFPCQRSSITQHEWYFYKLFHSDTILIPLFDASSSCRPALARLWDGQCRVYHREEGKSGPIPWTSGLIFFSTSVHSLLKSLCLTCHSCTITRPLSDLHYS